MSDLPSSASFPALGTTALLIVGEPVCLRRARSVLETVIADYDLACSRFREDSELCALNRAAGADVPVSPLLLDAVQAALRAAVVTDGDVDPTVGQALVALGYDRDFGELAGRGDRRGAIVSVPGWRTIAVDAEQCTIRAPRGVALDLGATAKAQAADQAARAIHEQTGTPVLVALGGDIAVAGPAPDDGWRVRVTDDHRAGVEAPGQWITLRTGGLATSSITTRRWPMLTGTAHHIVDPATGRPAEASWRTASVAAASCLDANIASTAAIVRGERAQAWLESLGLPARLVAREGTVMHVSGWPAEEDDLMPVRGAVPA